MWCVGALTQEYRDRMYNLLELYNRPYREEAPVICVDEKSKQLLEEAYPVLPMRSGTPLKQDYEYKRVGTRNLFVAVEPKGNRRKVEVTERRTKVDFVHFIRSLLEGLYAKARKVHLVLDNLNTHFRACFDEVLGQAQAATLLKRVVFHYTPKHASWLNMAEIEISALHRQCLDRRIGKHDTLVREVNAWQQRRNAEQCGIQWTFTREKADLKMASHFVT